jgi:hypothetical protein
MIRTAIFALVFALWPRLSPAVLHSTGDSPEGLVRRAQDAMGLSGDLAHIQTIRAVGLETYRDIVEFDHPEPPHLLANLARFQAIEGLSKGNRLLEEQRLRGSGGPGLILRTSLSVTAERLAIAQGGADISAHVWSPRPCWEVEEPVHALRLALEARDLVKEPDKDRFGVRNHIIRFSARGCTVRIYFSAESDLPSAIEKRFVLHRAIPGDMAWVAWGDLDDHVDFSNYTLVDGVRYPMQSDTSRNGIALSTRVLDRVEFEGAGASETGVPERFPQHPVASRVLEDVLLGEPIELAPDPQKPIMLIAPGVVQIPGSWYVTIVEQDDGLVILDAPISSDYSRRVLEEANRRFPGKPIKAVIASTSFYWHIAGIRQYLARGIPVYAHQRNVAVLKAIASATHSLAPDLLAQHPRAAEIRAISGPVHIGRGQRNAMVVMPISEAEQPMLMSWFPGPSLLHTADLVQPLTKDSPLQSREALVELKRSVTSGSKIDTGNLQIIGMHLSPTPWRRLELELKKE